jgi:hypothetical protein
MMHLVAALALRFSPDVIDTVRTGTFMESFTLLDPDRIAFHGEDKDLFIAIQPHYLMGEIFSSVNNTDGTPDLMYHRPGDRFRVSDQRLVLRYSSRGGAVVNTWQLPRGLCRDHNIFSTQQRVAVISVQETFDAPTTVCWFLNFRRPVDFTVAFIDGPAGATVRIGDNESLSDGLQQIDPKRYVVGHMAGQHLVVLDSPAGDVDLSIAVTSSVPFADWTDAPSLFGERGRPAPTGRPLYLVTVRNAKLWIWGVIYGVAAVAVFHGATILFMRPMKKLFLSVVSSSFSPTKCKID